MASGKVRRYPDAALRRNCVWVEDPGLNGIIHVALQTRSELEGLYGFLQSSFIWETSKVWQLRRPTDYFDLGKDTSKMFTFLGRANGKHLFEEITSMGIRKWMQILGAEGTGKTTVVLAICGFIIGSKQQQLLGGVKDRKLVYICASQFLLIPFRVLLHALVVAFGDKSELVEWVRSDSPSTLEDLVMWCDSREMGSLLFVVDDYDKLLETPLEKKLIQGLGNHCLVKLSSANSREKLIWSTSDKQNERIQTFHFDGPYQEDELQTWIAQSSLEKEQLVSLDYFTGGIPRLLRLYEEVRGKGNEFLELASPFYANKLWEKFIDKLATSKQLQNALHLVLRGSLGPYLTEELVNFTCFYKDGYKFRLLSPHLRGQAEQFILEQSNALQRTLDYSDIEAWANAVRLDCQLTGAKNPARAGCNVEGLVISVMRFRKMVFGDAFKHFQTYKHGFESGALEALSLAILLEGVLVAPISFNEKAVDVIYVKLLGGGVLKVMAIQITVAKWKAKLKKQSHKFWEQTLLPRWTEDLKQKRKWNVVLEFWYVNPRTFLLEDVDAVKVKGLGDVDACLREFDDLLDLPEPVELKKMEMKQCTGTTQAGTQCENKVVGGQNGDYRCHHHK